MRRKKLLIWSLLAWLFSALPGHGQAPMVSAMIDRDTILIGEQTTIHLRASVADSLYCTMPVAPDTLTMVVEVIGQAEIDPKLDRNGRDYYRQITITAFDTGHHAIPPFEFIVYDSLHRDTLHSQPLSLYVENVVVDTTQAPKDIKPVTIIPAPFLSGDYQWMWWLLLLIPIGVLIWYMLHRKKRSGKNPVAPVPEVPADIVALEALEQLEQEKLWQKNHHKAYHSRLTEIIRRYIEARFNIPALEQTSEVVLVMFKHVQTDRDNQTLENLGRMLRLGDAVKFAKYVPLAQENELSMTNARQFVEHTRPRRSHQEKEVE